MSKEQENKAIMKRWFREFWGNPWNPKVVDELAKPNVLVHYPMHGRRSGQEVVKKTMTEFREAFPDLILWCVGSLIAAGDYVFVHWDGGGTHTGPAFSYLLGSLPAGSGCKIRFTGTTVFRVENGKIAEEIGEEGSRWISKEKKDFWGWRFTPITVGIAASPELESHTTD